MSLSCIRKTLVGRSLQIALVLVFVLALAGCGDGGTDAGVSRESISSVRTNADAAKTAKGKPTPGAARKGAIE